jgi:hypothetical protein
LLGGKDTRAPGRPAPAAPPAARRPAARRAPSLARELLQDVLLLPDLGRGLVLPPSSDGSPDAAALRAVVDFCSAAQGELTPAGIVQSFIDSPHEAAIAHALANAEDQALTHELAGERLRAGVNRYWQQAERAGTAKAPADVPTSPEETERLRQLDFVRRGGAPATNGLETQ